MRKERKLSLKLFIQLLKSCFSSLFLEVSLKCVNALFFPRVSECLFVLAVKQTSWSYVEHCRRCGCRCLEKQVQGICLFISMWMFCQMKVSFRETHSSKECFQRSTWGFARAMRRALDLGLPISGSLQSSRLLAQLLLSLPNSPHRYKMVVSMLINAVHCLLFSTM